MKFWHLIQIQTSSEKIKEKLKVQMKDHMTTDADLLLVLANLNASSHRSSVMKAL